MLKRIVFAMVACVAFHSRVAEAAGAADGCKLEIIPTPALWRVSNIDVFASDPTFASFQVQLVNSGSAACTGRLALDTDGAPFGVTSGGRTIPYSLIDHASGADLTPRSGHSRADSGPVLAIPPGGETLARFDIVFPSEFQTDGTYSQQLLVQLTDTANTGVVGERAITLAADVASSATIGLSGDFTRVGGAADVDLGDLVQGSVKVPLVVHIKSTRAYAITSTSENGGKLVLAGTAWSIPYLLSLDGSTVDPAGGVFRSTPGDERRVDNLQLGFIVTGNTDVQAGRYSDVVTLEIALN